MLYISAVYEIAYRHCIAAGDKSRIHSINRREVGRFLHLSRVHAVCLIYEQDCMGVHEFIFKVLYALPTALACMHSLKINTFRGSPASSNIPRCSLFI